MSVEENKTYSYVKLLLEGIPLDKLDGYMYSDFDHVRTFSLSFSFSFFFFNIAEFNCFTRDAN